MSESIGWVPVKAKPAPVLPNPDAVRRRLQTQVDTDAAKARMGASVDFTTGMVTFAGPDTVIDKPEPLINGWLYAGTVNTLIAPAQGGKTWVGVHLACCVATGRPWHGMPVDQGPVWYLAIESPTSVTERIMTWRDVVNDGEPIDGLTVHPEGTLDSAGIDRMLAHVRSTRVLPRLIIVDTLRAAASGSIGNGPNAARLIERLKYLARQTGAAVLLLHHVGRTGTAAGAQELETNVDSRLRCGSIDGTVTLIMVRNRYGTEGEPVSYAAGITTDERPWMAEAPRDAEGASITTEVLAVVAANSGLSQRAVVRMIGAPADETIMALDVLTASKTIVRDQMTGAYMVS